jgi:hypothetical protein
VTGSRGNHTDGSNPSRSTIPSLTNRSISRVGNSAENSDAYAARTPVRPYADNALNTPPTLYTAPARTRTNRTIGPQNVWDDRTAASTPGIAASQKGPLPQAVRTGRRLLTGFDMGGSSSKMGAEQAEALKAL